MEPETESTLVFDSVTEDAFWGSDSSPGSDSTTAADDSEWGLNWGNKRAAPGLSQ